MKKDYKQLLIQIRDVVNDDSVAVNDGSMEFGLLWHIKGLVTDYAPRKKIIKRERSVTLEGCIRQSTNNPL